jgi:hypothetical protein
METLTYIALAIFAIVIIIAIGSFFKIRSRKSEYKDWKVGDKLILDQFNSDTAYDVLRKNGKSYAKLCGWTEDNVYVDVHDGNVYKIEWKEVKSNKSACWRRNYEEAKKVMGIDPSFSADIEEPKNSTSSSSPRGTIDGKPIELLTEIECQVYLKNAIESEDYKAAEAIRKRMENFR